MRDSIPDSQDYGEEEPHYVDRIHPLNAKYLRESKPHRFYADHFGAIMELTAMPMTEFVGERRSVGGGIIGINYVSADSRMLDTVIFNQEGELFHVNEYGYLDYAAIDVDRLYFLLNPVELNGWHIIRDPDEHEMLRGIRPDNNHPPMSDALAIAIRKTQNEYRSLMPTR